MLSCAYRSTEEIINQSRVDTRLTREDGHLQHGWWGGSSHTSETNNNYILIVNSPRLLSFHKVRTVGMIYGRVRICIRVGGRPQYWALFCSDQEQQFGWLGGTPTKCLKTLGRIAIIIIKTWTHFCGHNDRIFFDGCIRAHLNNCWKVRACVSSVVCRDTTHCSKHLLNVLVQTWFSLVSKSGVFGSIWFEDENRNVANNNTSCGWYGVKENQGRTILLQIHQWIKFALTNRWKDLEVG